MKYTISIIELIKRPIIRKDKPEEFLNKMTDDEFKQFDEEITINLKKEKTIENFPEWNAAYLAKLIDRSILYDIFKNNK